MKRAIVLMLAMSVLTVVGMAQTHDTTGPVLTAFSFAPPNPDAQASDATVTFTVSATDDLSGVQKINISVKGPTGIVKWSAWYGNAATSTTQTIVLQLPRYSAAGTWTVTSVSLIDAVGNYSEKDTAALTAAGYSTTFTTQ